jgi:hypothetical protein
VNGAVPSSTSALPPAPDASRSTVSLVLVSPSTVSWFQVRSTIGPRMAESVVATVGVSEPAPASWHPRMDHPDALGDTGHVRIRVPPATRSSAPRRLRATIGGPHHSPSEANASSDASAHAHEAARPLDPATGRRLPLRTGQRRERQPGATPRVRKRAARAPDPRHRPPVAALAQPLVDGTGGASAARLRCSRVSRIRLPEPGWS